MCSHVKPHLVLISVMENTPEAYGIALTEIDGVCHVSTSYIIFITSFCTVLQSCRNVLTAFRALLQFKPSPSSPQNLQASGSSLAALGTRSFLIKIRYQHLDKDIYTAVVSRAIGTKSGRLFIDNTAFLGNDWTYTMFYWFLNETKMMIDSSADNDLLKVRGIDGYNLVGGV